MRDVSVSVEPRVIAEGALGGGQRRGGFEQAPIESTQDLIEGSTAPGFFRSASCARS